MLHSHTVLNILMFIYNQSLLSPLKENRNTLTLQLSKWLLFSCLTERIITKETLALVGGGEGVLLLKGMGGEITVVIE